MSVPGIIEVDTSNLSVFVDQDPGLKEHLVAKAVGRINALLAEGKLDVNSEVMVDGKDDTLVLSGYILTEKEKDTLLESLKSIKGVQKVKHDLLNVSDG